MTQGSQLGEGEEGVCRSLGDKILNVLGKSYEYSHWECLQGFPTRWEQASGQAQKQKDPRSKLMWNVLVDKGLVLGWRCAVSCF